MSNGVKRPRGIYCTKEEWAWVSARAKASGMRIGEYLVHCGLTVEVPDGGVGKPTNEAALSPDEQRRLLVQVEELAKLIRVQLGRDNEGGPDLLGMIRLCFEQSRAAYLDKYGSFAFDKLMEEAQKEIDEPGGGPAE